MTDAPTRHSVEVGFTRRYFESERAAERHLEENGFNHHHLGDGSRRCRWPWTSRDGLIDADIRFNSRGFFVEYRA